MADFAYGEVYTVTRTKARLGLATTYHETSSVRETARLWPIDGSRASATVKVPEPVSQSDPRNRRCCLRACCTRPCTLADQWVTLFPHWPRG